MKRLVLALLFVAFALTVNAHATTVTVSAYQLQNLPFNPTNIGSARTLNITVTNGSASVTSSAAFPSNIVGIGGFQVLINGTQYVVSSVISTSSLTLTTNYSGTSGSTLMTLYPYVLLRAYATAGFQDNVTGQNVQPGTPGSGNFYKQVAVSIINAGAGNVAWMPEFTIPSTTDALINNQARYVFGFYRTDGSLLSYYLCGTISQLAIQPNSPATWTAICNFNSPGGVVPPANEAYTKTQIDQRFPNCSAGQLYYFDADGNILSCLTLGTNLSITSGVLNATGGGGGGGGVNPGVAGQLGGYATTGTTISPFTVGAQLTVSAQTLKGSGIRTAINAVVDYGAVCDGATNTLVALQNAVNAGAAAGGADVQLPAGNCRISGTLTVPGGVVLEGTGMQKTIISSVTNAVIINGVVGTGAYAFLGPTIKDLRIQGSKTAGTSQIALKMDDGTYFAQGVVENVQISTAGSHGLYVGNAFSSRFINIYSDDNAGYPFYINSANMPSNHYESLYAQAVNAGGNAGFRVLAGDFICISCNGINASVAGSWNAILGQSIAAGDASNVSAFAQWINSNFESALAGGIDHRYNSVSTFSGHNQFAGDGSASGSYIAIRYTIDSSIFPPYFAKGVIDDNTVFANSPASYYANSSPIRANDLPPLTINGQGPKVAGGAAQTAYYNSTNTRQESLYRSDGYYPTVAVTTSTAFNNPGNRYYEVTCASNCTLTLPWPGWYQPAGEPVVIKNLSPTSVIVTLSANSGGSVNTPNGYSLSTQYQTVSLMPDSTALDYRVINNFSPGVATRIPFFTDTSKISTVAGLTWDAGNGAVTSPARFWGIATSSGAPTYSFSTDVDTGFYNPADGKVGFGSNGSEKLRFQNNGLLMLDNRITWNAGETVFDLSGTGTPEGVVTAGIGSVYRRTNGGSGTTLYVKESGTGASGWVAVSSGGASAPFSDASALVKNSADATKLLTFSAASITTATTRTLTAQDANYTIAGTTVPLGGTGATSFTSNGILYGNGTGAIQVTAAGGVGTLCLTSTGGAAPVFGACSGSAATALSAITAAVAANTVASGDNAQIWQWRVTTNSKTAFSIAESAASTGTSSYLLNVNTLATSTAKPFKLTAGGTTAGVEMSTAGVLGAIGTGQIQATPASSANAIQINGGGGLMDGGTNVAADLTTSTIQLGVASSQNGRIQFRNSSNANTTLLQAGAPTGSITITLPAALPGTSGCLQISSAGVITQTGSACVSGTVTATGTLTANKIIKGNGTTDVTASKVTITDPTTAGTLVFGTDNATLTFQGTGTVVNRDSTDTFTNKTYNTAGTGNAFSINSQSITTVSGNTSKVGTTGTPSSGKCLEWDANGNIVTAVSNAACGSGGSGGSWPSLTSGSGNMAVNTSTYTSTLTASTALTNTAQYIMDFSHDTVGTVATGFGVGLRFNGEASDGAVYSIGHDDWVWQNQVAANRTGRRSVYLTNSQSTGVATIETQRFDVNAFTLLPSDVTAGSTGAVRWAELAANGSNYVSLKSPDSLASNLSWVWPSADGTNGQALTWTTGGTLAWATVGPVYTFSAPLVLTGTTVSCPTCGGGGGGNPFADSSPLVYKAADATATITISASGIMTGTNRTYTGPDSSGILVLEGATQTLTNKTIDSASNTILLAFSDLQNLGANVTIAGTTFNTTMSHSTGIVSNTWSGSAGTNSLTTFSSTSTVGSGYIVDIIANSASSTQKPLRVQSKAANALEVDVSGNVVIGSAALSTSATNGWIYMPSSAGTPSGTPAATYTGRVPLEVDTTNSRIYGYFGGAWVNLSATGGGGGANTNLNNLTTTSINLALLPQTTLDLGAAATAWRDLYLYGSGTYGSHSLKFTGTPTGNRTLTFPDATDTIAALGTVQSWTANQTFGSGNLIATAPAFTTSITTPSTAFSIANTTATTLNIGGAATTFNLAGGSGAAVNVGGGASAAELRLLEPSGSGTNYTGFKAPALAGNVVYTLPTTDGTSGQVLQTNGSAALSWTTASGGGTTLNASGNYTNIPRDMYTADDFQGTTANQVKFFRFIQPYAIVLDRSVLRGVVASAGGNFSFEIRSQDCTTTTYFNSGVLSTTGWGGADITTTLSSATLDVGSYCLLWTLDNSTAKLRVSTPQGNLMQVWNAGGVKQLGTCANSSSAGVLPGSCGAETLSNTQGILQLTLFKN